ncbi:MAG TPA: GAF domain-containing protein [Tepidisphaeraceae bacterium]|nr:GAF domain-containing protein [Tepidisphaeraceae bacterium]
MSAPNTDNLSETVNRLPLAEGGAPVGLYWGAPLILAVACIGLLLAARLHGDSLYSLMPCMAAVFLAGLIIAVRHRRWDRRQQLRRLQVLQALIDVSASGPQGETEAELFHRLPQAVGGMFDMKYSYLSLLEEDGRHVNIVSFHGPKAPSSRLAVDQVPMTRQCIETGQVVSVSDVRWAPVDFNAKLADQLDFRSMLQIPLMVQGKAIGVLVVGDPRPRNFTQLDMKRAYLWGCQAGVMVSNSRLYSRMSQTLRAQQQIIEHRDALYALNTAIYRPGSLDDLLQRIADLAPIPLELDAVLVMLRAEDDPETMYIAGATKPYDATLKGYRTPIAGSRAEAAWATGQPQIIEDATTEPKLNSHLRKMVPSESLIIEPLNGADGRPLGMLSLLRKRSGPFRPDQLDIARLFALRASAAIEMARLYQQTRRDADAKAILLRELNHRVKNNLAGIVGLLTINQPQLPEPARDWLDRVVERITAMAQSHEWLSEVGQRTTVAELVERTTRSLLVARPSGITVRTEVPAGASRLRTNRAASLAMAMQELCYNGIVHGLPNGGTLTIRARRDDMQLAVEVEDDDGSGHPAAAPIEKKNGLGRRSGIGLEVVRGLVWRELRGKFTLAPAPGGAIATLTFPLLADEIESA